MANVHYAEIGDVWKHLLLAEVLRIEAPRRYLESHAGSSGYLLTVSPERGYGVLRFASQAARSTALDTSAYRQLLARYDHDGILRRYPGSPLISLMLLGATDGYARGEMFVFCDLDAGSLATISRDARELGLPEGPLQLVEGDGVAAMDLELANLSEEQTSETFLLADPYDPLEPEDDSGTSLDLLERAATRGVKCMLWYGFDSTRDRNGPLTALRPPASAPRGEPGHRRPPWFGEISLRADDLLEVGFDPGVLGCGVVLYNVGREALRACGRLGEGLASIYADARPGTNAPARRR